MGPTALNNQDLTMLTSQVAPSRIFKSDSCLSTQSLSIKPLSYQVSFAPSCNGISFSQTLHGNAHVHVTCSPRKLALIAGTFKKLVWGLAWHSDWSLGIGTDALYSYDQCKVVGLSSFFLAKQRERTQPQRHTPSVDCLTQTTRVSLQKRFLLHLGSVWVRPCVWFQAVKVRLISDGFLRSKGLQALLFVRVLLELVLGCLCTVQCQLGQKTDMAIIGRTVLGLRPLHSLS